tara:strand:+ start:1098 stop:1292 length:195 start_codon:yes stop_codon:yes gene_type:complete
MKNLGGIKEGSVLWRVDYLDKPHIHEFYFDLETLHYEAKKINSESYIVTAITGDRLKQELQCRK